MRCQKLTHICLPSIDCNRIMNDSIHEALIRVMLAEVEDSQYCIVALFFYLHTCKNAVYDHVIRLAIMASFRRIGTIPISILLQDQQSGTLSRKTGTLPRKNLKMSDGTF